MSAHTTEPGGIDRALVMNLIEGLERQLAALRALVAPGAPDAAVDLEEQIQAMTRAANPDITSLERAAALVGRTPTTIARLCRRYPRLGRKIGGRWEVSKSALLEFCRRKPANDRNGGVPVSRDLLQFLPDH
jgi:hypothetical protein